MFLILVIAVLVLALGGHAVVSSNEGKVMKRIVILVLAVAIVAAIAFASITGVPLTHYWA